MNQTPQDKQPNKPNRQLTPSTEYAIAAVAGLLGGLVGVVASPLVLYFLSKKYTGWVKWTLWAAIGVVGAPIGAAATVGIFGETETVEQAAEVQPAEQSTNGEAQAQNVSDASNGSYPLTVTKTGLDFLYNASGRATIDGSKVVVRYLQVSNCPEGSPERALQQEWETTFDLEAQTWTDRVKPISNCLGNAPGEWIDYSSDENPFEVEIGDEHVVLKADSQNTDGSLIIENSQIARIDRGIIEAAPSLTEIATEQTNLSMPFAEFPDGQYQLVGSEVIEAMSGNSKRIHLEKSGNSVVGYAILYLDDNPCFTGTIEDGLIADVTYINPPYGGDPWTEPRSGTALDIDTYEAKTEGVSVQDIATCKEGFDTAQNQPVSTGTSISEKPAYLTASDPSSRINVRSQPTTSSNAPHYGFSGDKVVLLKEAPGTDGFTWYQVRFEVSGAIGWVRSDFIDQMPAPTPSAPVASNAPVRGARSGQGCDCPYDVMKNGRSCGANSAYSKPGGESPICYESDRP